MWRAITTGLCSSAKCWERRCSVSEIAETRRLTTYPWATTPFQTSLLTVGRIGNDKITWILLLWMILCPCELKRKQQNFFFIASVCGHLQVWEDTMRWMSMVTGMLTSPSFTRQLSLERYSSHSVFSCPDWFDRKATGHTWLQHARISVAECVFKTKKAFAEI